VQARPCLHVPHANGRVQWPAHYVNTVKLEHKLEFLVKSFIDNEHR
jgi:hypothetical protein